MSDTAMKRGQVTGVNGNLVSVAFETSVIQNEVAFIQVSDGARLKSEVIRVRGDAPASGSEITVTPAMTASGSIPLARAASDRTR